MQKADDEYPRWFLTIIDIDGIRYVKLPLWMSRLIDRIAILRAKIAEGNDA